MTRRHWLLAGAALALVAAAFLALLAARAFDEADALAEADARLTQAAEPADAVERPSAPLAGLARAMLATGDDWDYREALGLYRETEAAPPADSAAEVAADGRVAALLAAVAADAGDAGRASHAANLAGVLYVKDAALDRTSRSRFLQLGLESFREAVRLDAANTDAKVNLELLVDLLASSAVGAGDDSGSQGSTGAGASPGGSGY